MTANLPRVVCIVGPTSSGKTKLSLRLAERFDGEIINADARQCYTDFDIGTGKPVGKKGEYRGRRTYLVKEFPHYLMDFLPPEQVYTVAEWRKAAMRAVKGITGRKHLPIVVGGTGLYIKALVDNLSFPKVPPKPHLREAFEKKSREELVALLLKMDPTAGETVDLKNPRRVIRALEIVTFTGKPVSETRKIGKPDVDAFQIGIRRTRQELFARIDREVEDMIERGWIDEIRELLRKDVPLDAPAMTSIGYRELISYIKGEQSLDEAVVACKTAVRRYAKRQETWYRRDPNVRWVSSEDEAIQKVGEWLTKKE